MIFLELWVSDEFRWDILDYKGDSVSFININ